MKLVGGLVVLAVTWPAACGDTVTEPEIPNRTPVGVGTIPPQRLEPGESVTVDVSSYFDDPDGDPLAYRSASKDPDLATVTMSGSDLTIRAVSGGTATVAVTATDPEGLFAVQSTGVTVAFPNQAPVAVGAIPRQNLDEGAAVTVDVSGYFDDADGDSLGYAATSSAADVATVSVAGNSVTITGVVEGTAQMVVRATDPGGLYAEQEFDVVVVMGAGPGFRDDFDSDTLSSWDIAEAGAEVAEGLLRLTNSSAGVPGQATRDLTKLVDWEVRASVGRAHVDAAVRMVMHTGFSFVPALALEIGSGVTLGGEDTNFRVMFLDAASNEWGVINAGTSDNVNDSVGAFTEVTVSMRNLDFSMKIGDEQVHFETLTGAPPELQQLTAVGLWVVPYEQETGKTGLFDWIEVAGDAASDGADTDSDSDIIQVPGRLVPPPVRPSPAAAATPPPQAARPQRRSGRWPPPGSRD